MSNRAIMSEFLRAASDACAAEPFSYAEASHKARMLTLVDELDIGEMATWDVYVKAIDLINLACPDAPML